MKLYGDNQMKENKFESVISSLVRTLYDIDIRMKELQAVSQESKYYEKEINKLFGARKKFIEAIDLLSAVE